MVNKKGFLKTVEAALAVALTLGILLVIMPHASSPEQSQKENILASLQYNDGFRNCAIAENLSCVNQTVFGNLPSMYKESYAVNLTKDANFIPELPGNKAVKVEAAFIAGNLTDYNPIIVKLFYWS